MSWPSHAHTAADREHAGREGVALTELLAKWTGCWCGEQQYPDHDPRARDCPQHGSDDCRHMAEGIATDLARLAAQPVPAPSRSEAEAAIAELRRWADQGYSLMRLEGDLCPTCHTQSRASGISLTAILRAAQPADGAS